MKKQIIKKQNEMSAYEYEQVNRFIYQLYLEYGVGLEFEECRGIAFLEYAEVRKELDDIYNKDFLWSYSKQRIVAAFKKERKIRNEKIRLEAKLSLNQTIGEADEPVYTVLFPVKGDFTNYVCLWHDMKHFGKASYKLLSGLYWGDEDWEIMERMRMSADHYFELKSQLRNKLEEYIED